MVYLPVFGLFDGDIVKCLRFQDDALCEMAADEIERLHSIINLMIHAASKWDTMHTDPDGTVHHSEIGKMIANELKAIAREDDARFLNNA